MDGVTRPLVTLPIGTGKTVVFSPSIDCVIVARPTKSRPFYVQMIGRGTRIHPGKADCLIVDCVGVSQRHSLITADTLLGKDLSTGASLREIVEQEEVAADLPMPPADGQLVASKVNLFSGRPLHWVQTRQGAWVLSLGTNGMLRLASEDGEKWNVHHVLDGVGHLLWAGLPLGYAQGASEDYARKAGALALLDPNARWRQDPASDKQLYLLRKFGIRFATGLTKGEAYDLLTPMLGDR